MKIGDLTAGRVVHFLPSRDESIIYSSAAAELFCFRFQPEMCGNGIRCMARFLADLEGKKSAEYSIHTLAGTIIPVVSQVPHAVQYVRRGVKR